MRLFCARRPAIAAPNPAPPLAFSAFASALEFEISPQFKAGSAIRAAEVKLALSIIAKRLVRPEAARTPTPRLNESAMVVPRSFFIELAGSAARTPIKFPNNVVAEPVIKPR